MSAQMEVTVPFRDRFAAWWEGTEPVPRAAASDDAKAANGNGKDIPADSKLSLRERFMAWWEGSEIKPKEEELAGPRSRVAKDAPPIEEIHERPKEVWTPARIKVAERIWGAGYVSPGGTEHIMKLIKPIGLNPKMSFADLNAGAGGAGRAISETFGMWVTAMEPNPVLAAHGMEESTMAGMAKKVPVVSYDPESAELRPNGFDCVFVKEMFYTIVNKRHLFAAISKSLKKHGQLLFTDYVLAKTDHMEEATLNWAAHEPIRPEMWSIKQIRDYLEKQGLEIRIEDDMTEEMCDLILEGWHEALQNFRPGHFEPELGEALLAEAELWARRLGVLQSGDVRLYRVHALKK
ncbi:MAG TPA: methyltransferase domain-containing protein [Alphaproteobacteria bacterium]|jgi:SAM-dependent methyltransferase|nr:methyltransferase domain-containing protein [Alphaproteobacteria bacterium]